MRKVTIKGLASKIARKEGKKSQARIGDIREILSILSDLVYADANEIMMALYDNGFVRAKKKD